VDKELPPQEHIVDSASRDAALLLSSHKEQGITLVGPTRANGSWQAREEGAYDIDQFVIDWEQEQARCPEGKHSSFWGERTDHTGMPSSAVVFSQSDCGGCEARSLCTKAKGKARGLKLQPREEYEALQQARQRQASAEGKQLYKRRAGIEGTISQGVRAVDLRHARYQGLVKTHLQQIATAAAMNIDRLFNWFQKVPHAKTRTSRFAALAT
jgi:transposase